MKKTRNAAGQDIVLFDFDEDQIEVLQEQFENVRHLILIYCIVNDELIDDDLITRDRLLSIRELQWQFSPDHMQKQISQSIVQRYKTLTQSDDTKYVEKNLSGWMKTANVFFEHLNPMLYDVMDYIQPSSLWQISENGLTPQNDKQEQAAVNSNADSTQVQHETNQD